MKKLIVILFAAAMMAACGDGAKNRTSGANTDENVEENAGDVASPQQDTASTMGADTLSSPNQADSIR
jgi:hypothetical protein